MNLETEILKVLSTDVGLTYRQLVELIYGGKYSHAKYSGIQRKVRAMLRDGKLSVEKINKTVYVKSLKKEAIDWFQQWQEDWELPFDANRQMGWKYKWSCRWQICEGGRPMILEPDRIVPTELQSLQAIYYELRDAAARDGTSLYLHQVYGEPLNLGMLALMSYEPRPPDKFRLAIRDIMRDARVRYTTFIAPSCVEISSDGVPRLKPLVEKTVINNKANWHPGICPPTEFRNVIDGQIGRITKSEISSGVVKTGDHAQSEMSLKVAKMGLNVKSIPLSDLE